MGQIGKLKKRRAKLEPAPRDVQRDIEQITAHDDEQSDMLDMAARDNMKRCAAHPDADAEGREQLLEMCAQVDLLALVQQDTGETGKRTGERVDFRTCPICGHSDDFCVYTDTNTFSCFSESMAHLRKAGASSFGGNVCDYLKHVRHGGNNVAAIAELHELSGIPYEPGKHQKSAQVASEGKHDGFPPITRCKAVEPPRRAPVLIDGILRKGHTLLVTARSKAGKTFLMLGLAVAVACGTEWLGRHCELGRVLFVNPEVDPPSAENRLHDVAEAMGADLSTVQAQVDFWHLRGHAQGIEGTAHALFSRVERGDYALVILDSVYELYTGDENSAEDARKFFHEIDRIAKHLGCSVAMTHHHAKGIRSDLDALDRGSGSGVFGRKPDAPLDLIQVFPPSEDDAPCDGVTVWRVSDSGLREFPALRPFDVRFEYPCHKLVTDGSTADWKPRSGQQSGGRRTGEGNRQKSADRALRCELALAQSFMTGDIGEGGITASEAAELVGERIGETVKATTLKKYVEESEMFEVEQTSAQRWRVVPARAPTGSQLALG